MTSGPDPERRVDQAARGHFPGGIEVGGQGPDAVEDRAISRASAEVAAEEVLDLLLSRRRLLLQEGVGVHHEARRAEPALRAVIRRDDILGRVHPPVDAADALGGRHHHAVDRAERPQAGVDRPVDRRTVDPVAPGEHHRAGAAAPLAAPDLGPGQPDAVQVVHQQDARVRIGDDHFLAIEPEDESVGVRGGSLSPLRRFDRGQLVPHGETPASPRHPSNDVSGRRRSHNKQKNSSYSQINCINFLI